MAVVELRSQRGVYAPYWGGVMVGLVHSRLAWWLSNAVGVAWGQVGGGGVVTWHGGGLLCWDGVMVGW